MAERRSLPGNDSSHHFRVGNLYIPIGDKLAIRLIDLYERGRLSDWHYLGFDAARAVDHRVFTDGGPEDYSENLIGVMFEVRL